MSPQTKTEGQQNCSPSLDIYPYCLPFLFVFLSAPFSNEEALRGFNTHQHNTVKVPADQTEGRAAAIIHLQGVGAFGIGSAWIFLFVSYRVG